MKYNLKGNFFNNEFVGATMQGKDKTTLRIKRYSPANLDNLLWEMYVDYTHIDPIVESACSGFKTWKNCPLTERINSLKRYQECIVNKKEDIAVAIALESGKPLWEAKTEVSAMIAKIDITIDTSLPRIKNQHFHNILPQCDAEVNFRPLGPVVIIGPFNFPCHLANGQIVSALLAGNSIIFKPSEKTAYSGQLMAECFQEAAFPSGVINLIQGNGEVASRLIKSKMIRGVYFTGSKDTGLKILKSTYTDLGKLVALELGGKNTTIIAEDADLDYALPELIKACFLTAGQRCTSTSIVAIHHTLLESFVARFHSFAKKLIIDHPIDFQNEPFMGPLIDKESVENYLLYMGMAKREGLQEIMRGKLLEKSHKGHYVSPSIHIAEKFNPKSHFLTNELFGPNCTFIPYTNLDEAIEIANSNEYGLASAIFTSDKEKYLQCAREIEVGIFNWNKTTVGANSKLPFGGVKNSGNYRPAAVSTIDSCVYPTSSLCVPEVSAEMIDKNIKGLA